ncbi:MAG TPA: Gfo/Idh/MocA family oxidoreductase [Candidatus Sulfotelmatobacter sp.]
MSKGFFTRRQFMNISGSAIAAGVVAKNAVAKNAVAKTTLLQPHLLSPAAPMPPSDTVRFASIGTGVRGCELLHATLSVPGTQCVAVCDLYDSRHDAAREAVENPSLPATRNYKEILDRKDVDAVIIAVPDHNHRMLVEAACAAGKDVYCEKPMSHTVEDGFAMVEAAQKNKRIMQVGSQRVSSILYSKAKEIYESGKLGEVTKIDAHWDRNSPSGAWVYPIPPDANEKTIDWNSFLGDAPKRAFDPVRFFRWRCFSDYGEGLAGDLFVHLISGIHYVTSTNTVASRAQSSGGLFHFKDGRDFPDLIETFYDYPNFRVGVRCNLNNESGEFIAFYGTKGTMIIQDATVTFTPQDTRPRPEGYSVMGWPKKLRDEYIKQWDAEHPEPAPGTFHVDPEGEKFSNPAGYSDTVDHQNNFFKAVRSRKPVTENEVFANHAVIGCHLSNYAYFNKCIAMWDASGKKIVKA